MDAPIGTLGTEHARSAAVEHQLGSAKLDRIAAQASSASIDPAQAASVARGFEALFINELYKTMRQAMLDSSQDDADLSFGADILQTIGGMELAEQLARTGKGIGIAQMVYRYLTGNDDLPAITVQLPTSPQSEAKHAPSPSPAPQQRQSAPTSAPPVRLMERLAPFDSTIERAATAHEVPPWLIKAVIAAESAGDPTAISRAGAKGLMQLMEGTARDLGVEDAFDPEQNIWGGTRYLRMMLDRFGSIPLALAAYNAGPGAVERYGGIPPYNETQNYVRRVQRYAELFRTNT